MNEFLGALAVGALFGMLFGPMRLAGVDFGKWYRDPGEINEGNDRTWIGLVKWTVLPLGWLLSLVLVPCLLFLAVVVGAKLTWLGVLYLVHSPPETIPAEAETDLLARTLCWQGTVFVGLLFGIVGAQGSIEIAWRRGLTRKDHSAAIRLARKPPNAGSPFPQRQARHNRRLIVFCDGTWNSPDMRRRRETNVVQLMRATKAVDASGRPQISYYHLGIGTGNFLDRLVGGGAGIGLSSSVKACYRFLVNNYQPGDEILLFGFSRGAYVVRSVAGLIGSIGLLNKDEMFKFAELWDFYTLPSHKRIRIARDVLGPKAKGVATADLYQTALDEIAARRRHVPISCVGVWDTVGGLGIPGTRICNSSYAFYDTSLGSHVRHAFQALAMDERRGNFQPAIWVRQDPMQVLEQVWFPGVHSDIGGGYPEHGLADATLLWMAGVIEEYCLLDLDHACINGVVGRATAESYARGKLHDSRRLLWKLIAGPVPRPVGITDASERIHASALKRCQNDIAGDRYAEPRRQNWLGTIPPFAIALRRHFEAKYAFRGALNGEEYDRRVPERCGLCARVLKSFGGA